MCYYLSLESLPSFGISDVNRLLQTEGYSLSKLDSLPPESWKYAYIPLCFTYSDSLTGERRKGREVSLYLKRDGDGLYLEIRYSVRLQDRERNRLLRYYLTRRESNLIPGSFRYYFLDPYGEEEDSLCEKLYYYPETGDFYPRSYLSTSGVLYAQQRRDAWIGTTWDSLPNSSRGTPPGTERNTTGGKLPLSGGDTRNSRRGRRRGL